MSKKVIVSLLISAMGFSASANILAPTAARTAAKKAPLLTVIKSGQYKIADKSLADTCPAGKVCVPSTHAMIAQSKLILSLPLVGCLDSAMVTYKISEDADGVKTVSISALNVRNEESDTARCIAAPVAMKTIDLKASVMDKSLLKVEFLQEIAQ